MDGFKNELEDLKQQYLSLTSEIKSLTQNLTSEQFNRRHSEKKWSVAECISHLNITANGYLENIGRILKISSENKATGDQQIKFGLIGRFLKSLEPPPRFKLKAPKKLKPSAVLDKEKTMDEFFKTQETIIDFMKKAEGLNLNKIKVPSPISSLVKVRIGEFFAFTAVHERRHLWQMKEILDKNNSSS